MIFALLSLALAQAAPSYLVDPRNQTRRPSFTDAGARTALDVYLVNPSGTLDGGTISIGGVVSTEAHVVFDGGPVTVTNVVAVSVATVPTHAVTAQGPDGGTTFDVSGSAVTVAPHVVFIASPPLNPLLPRCNPVRRTGCQP